MNPSGKLTPEQAQRFVEFAIKQSALLPQVRVHDLRPWYRRPKVLLTIAAVIVVVVVVAILT